MSLQPGNDSEFYAPLEGVSSDFPAQLYARALGSNPWSVSEYNSYLQRIYYTIRSWDQAGWYYPTSGPRACWRLHPSDYSRWRSFMTRFSAFFHKGYSYYYVSSADEKTVRGFLAELRRWGNWFDSTCPPAAAPKPYTGLSDLGVLPIIFYVAGATAIAAGATLAAWLSKPEWSAGEYNDYMKRSYDTLLIWDKLGWETGCWKKDPNRRAMWMALMNRFGAFYHDHGRISDPFNPNDGEIRSARGYLAELATWGEWLQHICGADTGPETVEPPAAPKGFDYEEALKWGALLTLGVVGLNVIKGVREAFPSR